jgi:ssDNA-binding Zn-finger/Zn-ribbon topoisomerase 1
MVLREGPENCFYGCTGFPDECRHTLTIAQAIGLHRHIEKKKCVRNGKAAKKSAKKRIDLRAAVRKAEVALHRNEIRRQEVPSGEGAYRTITEKETNHRGQDYLEQSDPLI